MTPRQRDRCTLEALARNVGGHLLDIEAQALRRMLADLDACRKALAPVADAAANCVAGFDVDDELQITLTRAEAEAVMVAAGVPPCS